MRVPINQVRISYTDDWIRVHIGALEAAYNSTPFFPLFREALFSAVRAKPVYLHELNQGVNEALYRAAGIQILSHEPTEHITLGHDEIALLPPPTSYNQPFMHKHGFTGGLSGVDLIACCGRLPTR